MTVLTWRDWWASRTIRFNAYFAAAYTAIVSAFETGAVDASMLGLGDVWEGRLTFSMTILAILQNLRLRSKTTTPLHSRKDVGALKGSDNAFMV